MTPIASAMATTAAGRGLSATIMASRVASPSGRAAASMAPISAAARLISRALKDASPAMRGRGFAMDCSGKAGLVCPMVIAAILGGARRAASGGRISGSPRSLRLKLSRAIVLRLETGGEIVA